jgi:hypothetical protein
MKVIEKNIDEIREYENNPRKNEAAVKPVAESIKNFGFQQPLVIDKVDFCSYNAALYACKNWHYSKAIPCGKLVKIGAWEDDHFIGCVIFSRGSNNNIGKAYDLECSEVCELTRVAMRKHQTPVTQILSKAIALLKKINPGIKLIISYADCAQGHVGKIYQANNWIYEGKTIPSRRIVIKGVVKHLRSVSALYNTSSIAWLKEHVDPNAKLIKDIGKHKYLMPLDKKMRKQIIKLSKPYPKSN